MRKKKQHKSQASASGAVDSGQQLELLFAQYDIDFPIKQAIIDKQKQANSKPKKTVLPKSSFPPLKGSKLGPTRLAQVSNLKKLPPIVINMETDFTDFKQFSEANTIPYKLVTSYNKNFAIMPENLADYNKIMDYLEKNAVPHYTYSFGSEKNLKVVIRDVPINFPDSLISQVLKRLYDYPVISVRRMDRKPRKVPLVMVTLPRTDEGKAIFQMRSFCGFAVKVEKKDKDMRQCHRCQKFGHNSSHCKAPYVCVRCAGSHRHTECTLARTDPPKCANCDGEHTANYRDCTKYRSFRGLDKLRKTVFDINRQLKNCENDFINLIKGLTQ